LRVVVADDHAPTREAVREALEEQGCAVVADVGTAPLAVEAARRLRPDACLLDIHMPGGGVAAAGEITAVLPDVAVVMLTASQEDRDLFDALRAGASGYLVKGADLDRICPALRSVIAGESVLPRWLVRQVAEAFQPTPRRRFALPGREKPVELTEREAEVLDLMEHGLSTEEMAERLVVAPVTVRSHVAAILRKLRVRDRDAAVRVAHRSR
jgi:DNA-binding NarL/FixJ family response regulator